MIQRLAEYTIREGELDTVEEAIQRFVAAVRTHEPETIYRAYRRGDTLSFIHFMAFRDPEAQRSHERAEYTAEFVDALYPRCVEPPSFTDLTPVESW